MPFSINLKSGEKIFVNGAVLRVDRKVSIEFMNDVTFLLEAHVMQPEQTTTPLRQLYFIIQTMLIDPVNTDASKRLFDASYRCLCDTIARQDLRATLAEVRQSVETKRYYDALKSLRGCFALEDRILSEQKLTGEQQ